MQTTRFQEPLLLLALCLAAPSPAFALPFASPPAPSLARVDNLGVSAPLHALPAGTAPPLRHAHAQPVSERGRAAMPALLPGDRAQSGIAPTTPRQISPVNTGGTQLNMDLGGAIAPVSGAAGLDQFVEVEGARITVHDKTDARLLLAARDAGALFTRHGVDACDGQARVQYDAMAQRWIVTQVSSDGRQHCVAVSTTPDATSTYARYRIAFLDARAVDPSLAVWPDAYYTSQVMFAVAGGRYLGPRVCGLERNAVLRGADAGLHCHDLGRGFGPVQVAHAQRHVPLAPAFLLSVDLTARGSGERLVMWRYSYARASVSAPTAVPVAPFAAQGERFSATPVYHYEEGRESLFAVHTVLQDNGKAGLRWYELRPGERGLAVYQQGTHGPDGDSRWAGTVALDRAGNMALAYNAAGPGTGAGARYTGRQRGGAPGRLDGEEVIVNGHGTDDAGAPTSAAPYWRDQGSLSVDPADGCTFWSMQRYVPLSGRDTARARLASFRFDNCR